MILLELSRSLKVDTVTDDTGKPLVFFQNEEMSRKEVTDRGNDSLLIALAEPTREGATIRLKLNYRGTVISDAGNGVLFVGERGSWYPHRGGSDQFCMYDLKFRWPKRLELVEGPPTMVTAGPPWRTWATDWEELLCFFAIAPAGMRAPPAEALMRVRLKGM